MKAVICEERTTRHAAVFGITPCAIDYRWLCCQGKGHGASSHCFNAANYIIFSCLRIEPFATSAEKRVCSFYLTCILLVIDIHRETPRFISSERTSSAATSRGVRPDLAASAAATPTASPMAMQGVITR